MMSTKGRNQNDPDYSPPFDFHNKRPSYLDAGVNLPPPSIFNDDVVRSLESQFMQEDVMGVELEDFEPIKTYLRIRPYKLEEGEPEIITLVDHQTIIANSVAPGMKGGHRTAKKSEYKFTGVLDPSCSQKDVFEQAIAPLMDHLERGENCLVFSYGATNSGKTYTMQGRNNMYGIIPRTLDHIFNRFQDRLYKGADIQPFMYESTKALNEEEQKLAKQKKKNLLDAAAKTSEMKHRSSFASSVRTSFSSHCGSFKYVAGMPLNDGEDPSYDGAGSNMVCMWVSFVELYNEKCYDLLDNKENGKGKRKDLKVVSDKGGHAYIRDVTELPVFNEEEAYGIYVAGYKKLQIGSTRLNKCSSRSHCFFTIRIVELGVTKGAVFPMQSYRMTFCDLAGVERVSQTENTGGQLLESSSINKSLLSLLKVIRMIREKQVNGKHRQSFLEKIPFRESKLTRIFQGYFKSSTHIAMMVNVNPNPIMLESTIHTLQNSAIASNIIAYRPPEAPKIVVSSFLNNSSFLHSSRDLEDVIEESEDEYCDTTEPEEILPPTKIVSKPPQGKALKNSKKLSNLVVDVEDPSDSDKENDLPRAPSVPTVIQRRNYNAVIATLQEKLYIAEKENRRLLAENRTIEQETREKMVELYREGLDINNALVNDQFASQNEALVMSQKRCNELKSRLANRDVTTTTASTQTDN